MKNKKSFYLIIRILVIILITVSLIAFFNTEESIENYYEKFADLPRHNMEYSYALDISNPERAVDFYPYVFIAKVNKVIKTEYRNPMEVELTPDGSKTKVIYEPYTIYDITVIENLKGEIIENSNITIEQVGGVSKDQDYTMFPTNMGFLKENYYYILLAYASVNTGELRLESPYTVIELGTLSDKSTLQNILEISEIKEMDKIEQLSKEKNDNQEINKILTYKQAIMTPIDTKYYEQLAESSGVKDYKTFYFKKNMSKYDVNYKKSNDSKY